MNNSGKAVKIIFFILIYQTGAKVFGKINNPHCKVQHNLKAKNDIDQQNQNLVETESKGGYGQEDTNNNVFIILTYLETRQ